MKNLLLVPAFFLSMLCSAQELTGMWTGILTNDSTGKEQRYELALSEYRGKVTGYSYTTFVSNDTFYFSVKRMKATRQDSVWIVEDDQILLHNFPEKPAKGVRQINTFRLNEADSTWQLDGRWKTTATKRYYSISGAMEMRAEPDLSTSSLAEHMQELNLHQPLAQIKNAQRKQFNRKNQDAVAAATTKQKIAEPENTTAATVSPQKTIPENSNTAANKTIPLTESTGNSNNTATQTAIPATNSGNSSPIEKKPEPGIAKNRPVTQENKKEEPVQKEKQEIVTPLQPVVKQSKEQIVSVDSQVNKTPQTTGPSEKRTETINGNVAIADNEAATLKEQSSEKIVEKKPVPQAAASVSNNEKLKTRHTETIQELHFISDSLILSLYDNGVVDGDTVTVFLDGANILDRQKLKGVATRKTIYIPPASDSLNLVLFADNLGSIPPNTGLLTIKDGDQIYNVRFSADMKNNAAIILRRKNGRK